MLSILNRNLITLLILSALVSLVTVQPVAAQQSTTTPSNSWTWLQDDPLIFITSSSCCTLSVGNIAATTAGSVWVLQVQVPGTGRTVTSVTGPGSTTWQHCSQCQFSQSQWNGGQGLSVDVWYAFNGPAGTDGSSGKQFSYTLSVSPGSLGFVSTTFYELLPPSGATASFDTAANATPTNCTTCTGPTISTTATDFVLMNAGGGPASWNACPDAGFYTDSNGACIGVNIAPGTLSLSKAFPSSQPGPALWAMALKSTAGTFTPPAHRYSVVQFLPTAGAANDNACSTCTVTLPQATGAGHLLFVETASQFGAFINSVDDGHGGSWVVPSGTNTCRLGGSISGVSSAMASCAYLLSSGSG